MHTSIFDALTIGAIFTWEDGRVFGEYSRFIKASRFIFAPYIGPDYEPPWYKQARGDLAFAPVIVSGVETPPDTKPTQLSLF
jgi:hypothetical protein